MRSFRLHCLLVLAAGLCAGQSPAVSTVVNAASGILAPLPNSGIAEGSIFLILGSNMGPASVVVAPSAFQSTSLSGTSVSVTVMGTTVNVLMYYTSATQVAGLLPSNTPVGTGTITVTYNDKTSAPAPITVVKSNVGIFTGAQNGRGPGILTYADYSLVSSTKAANPGDVLILWATGLGPVSADDASGPQPGNMADVPVKVWLGGVSAPIAYQGRSGCCIGEDQIVFTVPDQAPSGCGVPLLVRIGDQVSNGTVMPVARGSRTCASVFPPEFVQKVSSGAPVSYGQIQLRRQPNSGSPGYNDNLNPTFVRFSIPPQFQSFVGSFIDSQPLDTCQVFNTLSTNSNPPVTVLSGLDIGPTLTVKGPNGSRSVSATSLVLSPDATYFSPGVYTFTAAGGKDIGPIAATFNMPASPTWTNRSSLVNQTEPINRADGLTINWTGGAPDAFLEIDLASANDGTYTSGASLACIVPMMAGTLKIPPTVMLALPPGPYAYIDVKPSVKPSLYQATGLDLGLVQGNYDMFVGGLTLK